MKLREFYGPKIDEIDLDTPLTNEELDYLDQIGVDPIDPMVDEPYEDLPSDEELLEIAEKDLDIYNTNEVELININDLEISGSLGIE
jgi:hypothetical protein